jgi:hypothetical protein
LRCETQHCSRRPLAAEAVCIPRAYLLGLLPLPTHLLGLPRSPSLSNRLPVVMAIGWAEGSRAGCEPFSQPASSRSICSPPSALSSAGFFARCVLCVAVARVAPNPRPLAFPPVAAVAVCSSPLHCRFPLLRHRGCSGDCRHTLGLILGACGASIGPVKEGVLRGWYQLHCRRPWDSPFCPRREGRKARATAEPCALRCMLGPALPTAGAISLGPAA